MSANPSLDNLVDREIGLTDRVGVSSLDSLLSDQRREFRSLSRSEREGYGVWYIQIRGPGTPPKWLNSIIKDVDGLLSLTPNWNLDEAPRVNPDSIVATFEMLSQIAPDNVPPPSLVPTNDGNVQVEWHNAGMDIEIEVKSNGPTYLYCEDTSTGAHSEHDITGDWSVLRDCVKALSERVI